MDDRLLNLMKSRCVYIIYDATADMTLGNSSNRHDLLWWPEGRNANHYLELIIMCLDKGLGCCDIEVFYDELFKCPDVSKTGDGQLLLFTEFTNLFTMMYDTLTDGNQIYGVKCVGAGMDKFPDYTQPLWEFGIDV